MLYDIVTGYSSTHLVDAVRQMISNGWTPIGGVSVAVDQGRETYAQAMVKHEL